MPPLVMAPALLRAVEMAECTGDILSLEADKTDEEIKLPTGPGATGFLSLRRLCGVGPRGCTCSGRAVEILFPRR